MTFSSPRQALLRALALSTLLTSGMVFAHGKHDDGHETQPPAATPVQRIPAGTVYGAALPAQPSVAADIGTIARAAMPTMAGAYSGRITEVCQKQGCWMVLSGDNGEFARVFMHGHAFSVPKNAQGAAVVYGTLREKKLEAAEIEHMKKDGASTPAARELQIDATSVLIRAS